MTDDSTTAPSVFKKPKARRGFAVIDPAKRRAIAAKGGKAAHAKGTAHQFTTEEARAAGRKGGSKTSENRAHMSRIGSIGGGSKGRGVGKISPKTELGEDDQ